MQRALGKEHTGSNFVAITDPGTSLERLALEEGFRRIFLNPSDIGGRYSVLSYFGLVPAALMALTSRCCWTGRTACGRGAPPVSLPMITPACGSGQSWPLSPKVAETS